MSDTFATDRPDNVEVTASSEPIASPGHETVAVEAREDSHVVTGSSARLSWGARTDVGLVRDHNEDSYLVQAPVFAVCDGMGGHAAGEVASAIAVEAIAKTAPLHADDMLLGAAVETANQAVMEGAVTGKGRMGMGCTASCAVIEGNHMAVAHVGDSRIYLLHRGVLVRLTHDHSYVEELVEAGEITADEARVHPARSVITRALGSDPDMYADHFTVEVVEGDRIIICSDGLSSMVEDSEIEAIAVSTATPQAAADRFVAAALSEGGHDNVSVVVVDIIDDGLVEEHRKHTRRNVAFALALVALATAVFLGLGALFVSRSWFVGINGTTVGIYQGVNAEILGRPLYHLVGTTSVQVADLPDTTQKLLADGVPVASEQAARETVISYREQIDQQKTADAATAETTSSSTAGSADTPVEPQGFDENAPSEAGGTEGEAHAASSGKGAVHDG